MDEGVTEATYEITEESVRRRLAQVLIRREPGGVTTEMGIGSSDVRPGRDDLAATVDGGWAVPTWPRGAGGRDATAGEAALIARVRSEFVVPDLYIYLVGLSMVGPTLLEHGTVAQQARWLRPIADGSEIWCQLFSEPEAGSDLANVGLRAERRGDGWCLRGQKVWVSRAMWARWGLLLARTDPDVPKHAGLTMFAVDVDAPGLDVRPLVQMSGDQHFSEVFIDDVVVPDGWRIGSVGEGWKVAMSLLAHERTSLSGEPAEPRPIEIPGWLLELAREGALGDPVVRDRAMQVFVLGEVGRLAVAAASSRPGAAGSGLKMLKGAQAKTEAYLRKDARGALGMLTGHAGHLEFLTAPSMSIRGGTDEIQRTILAERVLGLPAEPRGDRSLPWRISRRGDRS